MPAPKYMREELADWIAAGWCEIGEYSYGAPTLRFPLPGYRFICGRYCSFAPGVQVFLGGAHRPDWVTTYPFPAFPEWPQAQGRTDHHVSRGDVVVGNDVWVGSTAQLNAGVRIGDGAVIAGRAVVTRDVPPYAIVGGNPAQIIRYRFDEATIAALLEIAWWDWPEERVRQNLPLLLSGDIQAFIDANRP